MENALILFDIGQVLVKVKPEKAYENMAKAAGLSTRKVRTKLEGIDIPSLMDLEHMKTLCDSVKERIEIPSHAIINAYLDVHVGPIHKMIGIRDNLESAGHTIGILSNTSAASRAFIRGRMPTVFSCSGPQIYSDLVGSMKPSPEIYHEIQHDGPLVFIDDKPENLRYPTSLGWVCIQFGGEQKEFRRCRTPSDVERSLRFMGYGI